MELHLAHDFTLNPDGSGKVTVRWDGPLSDEAPTPEAFLQAEVAQARGVDAWSDLRCAPQDDRLVFAGTAWFRDIEALRFHCQGFHLNLLDLTVTQDQAGECVVATRRTPEAARNAVPDDASDADLGALLAAEREKLEGARGFLAGMFGGLTCSVILRLPGILGECASGRRIAQNAMQAEFAGSELLALVDRLLEDDALLTTLVRQGGATPETVFALLGGQGPIRARTRGGCGPQFDFAAEVAAADAAFAILRESLGVPRGPEPGEPLRNVRVIASKVVREADPAREIHPMGQNYAGVAFTLLCDLPRPVLAADEATITACIAADGRDLTPENEWNRRIHFPRLSTDRTSIFFDVEVPNAEPAVTGMQEISGTMMLRSADGAEVVDLGFPELTEGTAGTQFGATLGRCETSDSGDAVQTTIEIRFALPREMVQALELMVDGEAQALEQVGYSASNDECTLTYTLPGELPAGAHLRARVASDLRTRLHAFRCGSVDLLGQPLPAGHAPG